MAHYPLNHPLRTPYRLLAGVSGLYLTGAGLLGLIQTWGDPFLHRGSDRALGLLVNPAASWLILLVGVIVLAAAVLGGNLHHRVNLAVGWLLLALATLLLAFIRTDANVLNAAITNVVVYSLAGLFVLTAALYGKVED